RAFLRSEFHAYGGDARGPGGAQRQRENHFAAAASRRYRAKRRGDSQGGRAAHRLLRSESRARSRADAAARARARQRLGDLSGSRDSRGWLGGAIPFYERGFEPPGGKAFGRGTRAG